MSIRHTLALAFVLCAALATAQTSLRPIENITTTLKRRQHLQSYTGRREYHLLYTGFPGRKEADMVVDVKYEAPDTKDFTVTSQSGSRFVANHIFKTAGRRRSRRPACLRDEC